MPDEEENVKWQTTAIYANGHQNKRTFKTKNETMRAVGKAFDEPEVVAITVSKNLLSPSVGGVIIKHASCKNGSCKK